MTTVFENNNLDFIQEQELEFKDRTLQENIQLMINKRFGGNPHGIRSYKNLNTTQVHPETIVKNVKPEKKNSYVNQNIKFDSLHNQENFGERKRIKP